MLYFGCHVNVEDVCNGNRVLTANSKDIKMPVELPTLRNLIPGPHKHETFYYNPWFHSRLPPSAIAFTRSSWSAFHSGGSILGHNLAVDQRTNVHLNFTFFFVSGPVEWRWRGVAGLRFLGLLRSRGLHAGLRSGANRSWGFATAQRPGSRGLEDTARSQEKATPGSQWKTIDPWRSRRSHGY